MKNTKIKIVESDSYDPYINLALEEYLFNHVEENEVVLYLWQNENTVVIGRNQNAWRECRIEELKNANGKLARRLSGGGAVYHDLGNLNFTFLTDKKLYNLEKQLKVILDAVRAQGIEANFQGRNDILAEGKKFSGNAFYFGEEASFHHGTLLIDVNKEELQKFLQVSQDKMDSKGIKSVVSRVVNLKEINQNISIGKMKECMKEAFIKEYGEIYQVINFSSILDTDEFKKIYEKYSKWQWIYGETPEFNIHFEKRFTWGGINISLNVQDGMIKNAKVYSDSLNADLFEQMTENLKEIKFDMKYIIDAIRVLDSKENKDIISDILYWLKER